MGKPYHWRLKKLFDRFVGCGWGLVTSPTPLCAHREWDIVQFGACSAILACSQPGCAAQLNLAGEYEYGAPFAAKLVLKRFSRYN